MTTHDSMKKNCGTQMKHKNILSKLLQQKRLSANLSQKDVAEKLGYNTPQFISNWERGLSQPPINILKKLADLYKMSADELFESVLHDTIEEIKIDFTKKFTSSKDK